MFAVFATFFRLGGSSYATNCLILFVSLVSAFGIVVFFYMLKKRAKEKRRAKREKDHIFAILEYAFNERAHFDIMQKVEGDESIILSADCLNVNACSLILAIENEKLDINQPVCIFFRIPKAKGGMYFYSFDSKITGQKSASGRSVLSLDTPVHFRNEQKRAFFRLQPMAGAIASSAMWNLDQNLPSNLKELGIPIFTNDHENPKTIKIEDISASGIRVVLEGSRCHKLGLEYEKNDKTMLLLSLHNDDNKKLDCYLLACSCRFVSKDFVTQSQTLGLQFKFWGRRTHFKSENIVWNNVGTQGEVPPILKWILAQIRATQQYKLRT